MDLNSKRIEEIHQFLKKLELEPAQQSLLKIRWLDTVKDYEQKAARDVWRYRIFYLISMIAGLIIPIITNLDDGTMAEETQDILVSLLGVIAAFFTGLIQLVNYRKRWAFYREQSHLIKQEGFAFLGLTNQYFSLGTHKAAFRTFLGNLEKIIGESMRNYQDFFDTDDEDNMVMKENAKAESASENTSAQMETVNTETAEEVETEAQAEEATETNQTESAKKTTQTENATDTSARTDKSEEEDEF